MLVLLLVVFGGTLRLVNKAAASVPCGSCALHAGPAERGFGVNGTVHGLVVAERRKETSSRNVE